MALSDVCYEVIDELQKSIIRNLDREYSAEELSHIIDAIYDLGTFSIQQDCWSSAENKEVNLIMDEIVLFGLIDEAYETKSKQVSMIFAGIAKVNSKLCQSITNMIEHLTMKDQLFEAIKTPHRLELLKEIKSLMDA